MDGYSLCSEARVYQEEWSQGNLIIMDTTDYLTINWFTDAASASGQTGEGSISINVSIMI